MVIRRTRIASKVKNGSGQQPSRGLPRWASYALTGHRYHDRPMREWFISELQECLAVSAHDVQRVLDYLATRGDLDLDRVGMFAEGWGATIGILASAADPRIKVFDTVNPWGDWPTWMSTSPVLPADERADYVKPQYLKNVA